MHPLNERIAKQEEDTFIDILNWQPFLTVMLETKKKKVRQIGNRYYWIIDNIKIYDEEFDPGSGWTLAAGLTHASRGVVTFG